MKSGRSARGIFACRARIHSTVPLTMKSPPIRPNTSQGLAASTPKSALMPTAMKKSPSKRPLNGSTAASISWRYSDSASSTPPRKAPSAIDRPACSKASAITRTSSSANAVKISRSRVRAMWRNTGRATSRPPPSVTTITDAASASFCQEKADPVSAVPRSGRMASIGITAMSWKSSTANVPWPPCVASAPRSVSGWSASAVEESESAMPAMSAMRRSKPAAQPTSVMAAIEPTTCNSPSPRSWARIVHRRRGSSSRPMTKSRNTTPSSANARMWSAVCTS